MQDGRRQRRVFLDHLPFLVAVEIHLCCFGSAVDSQRAPPSWVLFSSPDAVDLNMSEWATMSVVSRWPDKSDTIVP